MKGRYFLFFFLQLIPAGGEAVSQLYGFSLEKSIFDADHVIIARVGMIERDF